MCLMKNKTQKKQETVLKMIEGASSFVSVLGNKQPYQFFPFIVIIIIVSHVKCAHGIKVL